MPAARSDQPYADDSRRRPRAAAGRASVRADDRRGRVRGAAPAQRADERYDEDFDGGGPRGPGGPGGRGGSGDGGRRGPKPRWGRIALVAVLALALVAGLGGWFYARGLNDDLARTDPFAGLTDGRPAKTVEGSLNILLVGTDSRDPDAPINESSQWRADTVILMHIPSDHSAAYLVSIPRDLYVPIPADAGATCDSGNRAKVNAAFAWGGLPLAVRTVECFTDVRIDHVAAIDFGGFKEVTDALGGVELKVERTITSIHKPYRTFEKGTRNMNGAEALDWIRQRKQFPDGDFARMRHQQEFLKALMDKAASTGTLTNPARLNSFLKAVTAAVTVDEGFSLTDMALQFRNLRSDNLHFVTSPHLGSQTINGESVVVSDREQALTMYQAIGGDKMAQWMRSQEESKSSPTPGAN
ncbi:LCP family protein [Micromonosporaceae bacterium DT194]|uniref:LCP family protein n=1 Tax=Melissospora conviva TaxID=3388432 RepID=UPI003C1B105B